MAGSTGTLEEQAKFRVDRQSEASREIICPSCSGGNPHVAQNCMWCGRTLRDQGTPTSHLARYAGDRPHMPGQIQPYQSGQNPNPQTMVYLGQGQNTTYMPPASNLPPTQVMSPPAHGQSIQPVHPQYVQPTQYQDRYPGQYPGPNQGYGPYQQPPIVIHTTQTVVVVPQKSVGVAVLLSFFFGPFGMLYSTVWGGLAIFFLNIYLLFTTLGLGWFFTWIVGIIWAGVAASMHNSKAVTTYQQTTAYPPAQYHR